MIVGSGLLAKNFKKYRKHSEVIIFASGVSNSSETASPNFARESNLLSEMISSNLDKHLVYFSSCDVVYTENIVSKYYQHKLQMEEIIQASGVNYSIFRLPQIIGNSSNQHSLINFFVKAIMHGELIDIWEHAYKNLITINDIFKIADFLLVNKLSVNKTVNIVNPHYYSVLEIIDCLEKLLDKKCNYRIIDKGNKPTYVNEVSALAASEIGAMFQGDYLGDSLKQFIKKDLFKA